jgi:hypothetical protein
MYFRFYLLQFIFSDLKLDAHVPLEGERAHVRPKVELVTEGADDVGQADAVPFFLLFFFLLLLLLRSFSSVLNRLLAVGRWWNHNAGDEVVVAAVFCTKMGVFFY